MVKELAMDGVRLPQPCQLALIYRLLSMRKQITYRYRTGLHILSRKNEKLKLPIELKRLGTISYKGKFDGFVTDFTTHGKFKTGLGNLVTELSIKIDIMEGTCYFQQ